MSRSVERRLAAQKQPRASRRAEPRGWPLPPEWDQFIPPQAVHIVEFDTIPGIQHSPKGTRPAWNEQWLRGLEAYVRSIVRDELRKANNVKD